MTLQAKLDAQRQRSYAANPAVREAYESFLAHLAASGMAAGTFRRQDPRLLLLSTYSTVVGVATEVEVVAGEPPTVRLRGRAAEVAGERSVAM